MRIEEIVLEGGLLLEQHEQRFSEENQRQNTILAALRRIRADPTVDIESLKRLSEWLKQGFNTTLTEFTAQTERMTALSEEARWIIGQLSSPSE